VQTDFTRSDMISPYAPHGTTNQRSTPNSLGKNSTAMSRLWPGGQKSSGRRISSFGGLRHDETTQSAPDTRCFYSLCDYYMQQLRTCTALQCSCSWISPSSWCASSEQADVQLIWKIQRKYQQDHLSRRILSIAGEQSVQFMESAGQ
jgi:hypothetical protein